MTTLSPQLQSLIARLTLSESVGENVPPGFAAALEDATPLPKRLPHRTISREEFLQEYVVPWLAAELRARDGFCVEISLAEYGVYARNPSSALYSLAPRVVRAAGVACTVGALWEVVGWDTNSLLMVAYEYSHAGAGSLRLHAERRDDPKHRRALSADLRKVAAHLQHRVNGQRGTWPTDLRGFPLTPVITRLHDIANKLADEAWRPRWPPVPRAAVIGVTPPVMAG